MIEITTRLLAPAAAVWARAVTPEGINDELRPILRMTELEPGWRFRERSRTSSLALWSHERIVEPDGESACTVTDRLGWETKPLLARLPGSDQLVARALGNLVDVVNGQARAWAKAQKSD